MKTFKITKNSQYIQSIQLDKGIYTYSCNVKSDATVLTIAFQNTMGVWTDFEIPILGGMWNKKAKLTFELKEKMVNFDLCKYASNESKVYVQVPMLEEGTNASTPKSSDLDDLEEINTNKSQVEAKIDTEKQRINDIFNDNIADPSEKQYLSNLWQEIYAEYPKIRAQADTYAIDKATYEAKYTALKNILEPVLANLTVNTTVSGASVRTAFSQYYDSRTLLQNAIQNKINQNAQAAADEAKNEALALSYLKEAIGQDAVINGALFTLVTMLLKERMDEDVTAGISGRQAGEGGQKNLPAFWAGGTYDQAIGGTAKAIIRHDGSSKFTDAEIEGKITVTEGFLANWKIQGNTIISQDRSVEIDSETNTISLVNSSGGMIVIKNKEIPDISLLFAPNLTSEESLDYLNYGYMGHTRISHIFVSILDNTISELIISSYEIVHMMFVEIETEIYMDSHIYIDLLHDDVFSRRLAEDRHRIFLHDDDGKNYTKTINVPSMRIPIYESGKWSIRVTHSKTTESGVIANDWFASATISGMGTVKAETVINRTEIGSNGMVVATSPENYTYDAGDLFQVRRGKYGLRVTDEGIKGCDTMDLVVNDWYDVKLTTP